MDKTKFEQDIMSVLEKHGYKIEGIKQFYLRCNFDEIPEINIEYYPI